MKNEKCRMKNFNSRAARTFRFFILHSKFFI